MAQQKKLVSSVGGAKAVEGAAKARHDVGHFLLSGWFPPNPAAFDRIRRNLDEGAYDANRGALIADLKQEFSLLSFVLRTLGENVSQEQCTKSPLMLLHEIDASVLKKIIPATAGDVSPHLFNPEMSAQLSRLRHLLISCSTAEALAEKYSYHPDSTYVGALARQLGVTLIAFNYPRVFNQALSRLTPENNQLERDLGRSLGVSPTALGMKLMLGWNRSQEVSKLIDAFQVSTTIVPSKHSDLDRIFGIAEKLAQLSDSEHYPCSSREWDYVVGEIKNALGPEGLELINEKVGEYSASYKEASPIMRECEVSQEKSLQVFNGRHAQRLYDSNQHLKRCSAALQESMKKVYQCMRADSASPTAVNVLVSEVIPLFGFDAGCVYLANERKGTLVPMLRIGAAELSRFRQLQVGESKIPNPIIEATYQNSPIVQDNFLLDGDAVSAICGSFGTSDKRGVLYLEMGDDLAEDDHAEAMIIFKAVRQALSDCLGLD